MKTFLLYWNPHFSSYKIEDFLYDFDFEEGIFPDDFNWSIYEHEKAHAGDRFIFIKVGYEKPTGIIGTGHFTSEPYLSEDWSGQGRKVWYMDMEWETAVDPESDMVAPTEALQAAVPDVNWTTGKAGVEVDSKNAFIIESIWQHHLEKFK